MARFWATSPWWCDLFFPGASGVVGESPREHLDAWLCEHGPGSVDRWFYYYGRPQAGPHPGAWPSLAAFGVSPVLENPVLQLFSGSTQLRSNDDWQSASNSDDIIATAIPPQDSKEASILVRLEPGAYTTVVTGANDTTGIALVEIYEMDMINLGTQ